jgi:hypothetical protein
MNQAMAKASAPLAERSVTAKGYLFMRATDGLAARLHLMNYAEVEARVTSSGRPDATRGRGYQQPCEHRANTKLYNCVLP